MVKDQDIYPLDTVVRLKKTNQFALIRCHSFLKDGRNFLNYLAQIEGRGEDLYAVFHEDVELECPPKINTKIS